MLLGVEKGAFFGDIVIVLNFAYHHKRPRLRRGHYREHITDNRGKNHKEHHRHRVPGRVAGPPQRPAGDGEGKINAGKDIKCLADELAVDRKVRQARADEPDYIFTAAQGGRPADKLNRPEGEIGVDETAHFSRYQRIKSIAKPSGRLADDGREGFQNNRKRLAVTFSGRHRRQQHHRQGENENDKDR